MYISHLCLPLHTYTARLHRWSFLGMFVTTGSHPYMFINISRYAYSTFMPTATITSAYYLFCSLIFLFTCVYLAFVLNFIPILCLLYFYAYLHHFYTYYLFLSAVIAPHLHSCLPCSYCHFSFFLLHAYCLLFIFALLMLIYLICQPLTDLAHGHSHSMPVLII